MDGLTRNADQALGGRLPAMSPGKGDPGARGATLVEFALVLPVFLLMVMGIFDVANMMRVSLGMQHAVRLGVEAAISGAGVDDGTRSVETITSPIKEYLTETVGLAEDAPVITVRSWEGTDTSGEGTSGDLGGPCDMVEVKVEYDYPTLEAFRAAMSLFANDAALQIPLSRAERRVNEPWASCD